MATYNDPWSADYAQLFGQNGDDKSGDIYIVMQEQIGLTNAVNAYAAAMQKVKTTGDAMVAFTMIAWLIANQGFMQLNYQSAINGGALKAQEDLTALNNDIEDMTNQTDDATATQNPDGSYTYSYHKNYLDTVAQRAELLHQKLDINGTTGWDNHLTDILGQQASNTMSDNFLTIRHQINDTNYADNGGPGVTIYFDAMTQNPTPATDKYTESYCEFQINLETRGDPKSVNEALKAKTDAFNENTSTTQSTNAASQEVISNDNNKAKAVQAFVVAMFHAIMDVISATTKAVQKG